MKYVLFRHFTKIENDIIKTHGIVVFNKLVPVRVVKDISTDYEAVRELVSNLNNEKVELVHLDDILEDFLFENV